VIDGDAVVNDVQARHRLAVGKPVGDGDVLQVGISLVLLRQRRLVRVVQRDDDRPIGEPCKRHCRDVIEVDDIRVSRGIMHRPGNVIEVLELRSNGILYRPVAVLVPPLDGAGQPRIAIGVDGDLMTA